MADFVFGEQFAEVAPDAVVAVGALLHFAFGFFYRPILVDDAVHGGDKAGAVGAVVAVDENRAVRLALLNQVEGFGDLARGDAPGEQGFVEQGKAVSGEGGVVVVAVEIAQVDDAFDAQFGKLGRVGTGELLAAVEFVVDAVEVGVCFDGAGPLVGFGRAAFIPAYLAGLDCLEPAI